MARGRKPSTVTLDTKIEQQKVVTEKAKQTTGGQVLLNFKNE